MIEGSFRMETIEKIRTFIVSNFFIPDPAALNDDASLLESGVVDSTGVLELIAFLEDTFAISVDDAEMSPENLGSITRINAYLAGKRG